MPDKTTIMCLALLAVVTALKSNTLQDPHYWDAMSGVVALALDSFDHHLRVIHPPQLSFGHPPLQPLILAIVWKAFGPSLFVSHAFNIALGLIGLYFTYRLGALLFHPAAGLGAAVLLAFNQMFFAQMGLLNDAIPLLTLGVLTVYFHLQQRRALFFLAGTLLVLTKETASLVLGALAVCDLFDRWLAARRLRLCDLKQTLLILLPVLPLIGWFVYQRAMIGFVFLRGHLPITKIIEEGRWDLAMIFVTRFFSDLYRQFGIDTTDHNINKYNVILSVILLAALISRRFRHLAVLRLFTVIVVLHGLLFSFTVNLPRYFVPLLPFYYLVAAEALYVMLPAHRSRAAVYAVAVTAMCVLFATNYKGARRAPGYLLESNLEYRQVIATHRKAARFIESYHPNATVLTHWPMSDELADERFGYVTRKVNVIGSLPQSPGKLLVYYSFQSSYPTLVDDLGRARLKQLARFELDGKSTEVYEWLGSSGAGD